jgi:hypothetical protein
MRENNVNIRFKEQPVLIDRVLQELQMLLKDKLPWLDYAFGKSHRFVDYLADGNKMIYPATYIGNGEYVSLMPNDNFGNFSWFDIYDPQEIILSDPPMLSLEGAIVFWFNLSNIYEDKSVLYTEEIKNEIIEVLSAPGILTNGRFSINSISERPENLYKSYSIDKIYNRYAYKGEGMQDIDKQFFMYPYAGLRIEFKLKTRNLC